ncbi:hypothetical protein R6Q59_015646 [Mikania micrantha]
MLLATNDKISITSKTNALKAFFFRHRSFPSLIFSPVILRRDGLSRSSSFSVLRSVCRTRVASIGLRSLSHARKQSPATVFLSPVLSPAPVCAALRCSRSSLLSLTGNWTSSVDIRSLRRTFGLGRRIVGLRRNLLRPVSSVFFLLQRLT